MRKWIVAGNWKMNTDLVSGRDLAAAIAGGLSGAATRDDLEIVICPPFISLAAVREVIDGSVVRLGAQNVSHESDGAFTGEISTRMLRSVGCSHVIVGHSERRTLLGESDLEVRLKGEAAVAAGLTPILCVGESLDEREGGAYRAVVERQIREAFTGIPGEHASSYVVAYEPIWAIGTGKVASPEQAQEMHAFIRGIMGELYGVELADNISILYGGSVKPDNAADLFSRPDIDGALVGGASLKADSFLGIVGAA
jgi:triosephosphate isomerase